MNPTIQKWISVADALPKVGCEVFIHPPPSDYTLTGYLKKSRWFCNEYHSGYGNQESEISNGLVTHWRLMLLTPTEEAVNITVTFNPATHKLMPLDPDNELLEGAFAGVTYSDEHSYLGVERHIYNYWVLAAPELGSE